MKFSLGMIVKNEAYYLSVILPIIRDSFDEFVAVDAESTDETHAVLSKYHCKLIVRSWTGYSDARNVAIQNLSGDWACMLDADEAMFPSDLQLIRQIVDQEPHITSVTVPKHEFVGDHDQHEPYWYPDLKKRIFKLGIGYHYVGSLHERLQLPDGKVDTERKVPEIHMYHYGQAKPSEMTWLRHTNYDRHAKGLSLLTEIPADVVVQKRAGVPFLRDHPLKGIPPASSVEAYHRARS